MNFKIGDRVRVKPEHDIPPMFRPDGKPTAGIHGDRRWHHPVSMYGEDVGRRAFAAAKAQGYLAQDNVWRTTDLGDRALREAGLLPDERKPTDG